MGKSSPSIYRDVHALGDHSYITSAHFQTFLTTQGAYFSFVDKTKGVLEMVYTDFKETVKR